MLLPGPIKKILGILRGKVSPIFIFLSISLGFWFGLIPGFSGIQIAIIAAVLILNIHIGLFLLASALGTAICFAAAPVLYYVGLGVHAGLSPILNLLSHIPIIGMTDFARYSVAGALVIGPVLGSALGLAMAWSVIKFRNKMVKLEQNSPAFKQWYSKTWVRLLDRILVSKRAVSFEQAFSEKKKLIRKPGLVFVIVVFAIVAIAIPALDNTLIKEQIANAMTKANGAEVNIETFRLSPVTGRISMANVQMTDPENPEQDRLSISKIEAQAAMTNVLTGSFVMNNVELATVRFDQERETAGKVLERRTKTPPPTEEKTPGDHKKLEDYVGDAQKLRDWAQKLQTWLPESKPEKTAPKQVPHKYLEYLQAVAVVPTKPRIQARTVLFQGIELDKEVFGNSNVVIKNVSDAPQAASLPMSIDIKSIKTDAVFQALWDYSVKDNPPLVSGNFSGIDITALQNALGSNLGLDFENGIAAGQFTGRLTADNVDLTFGIELSQLNAKSSGSGVLGLSASDTSAIFSAIDQLELTVRVFGSPAQPSVAVDTEQLTEQFQQALIEAGKGRLAEEIGSKIGDKIPEELGDIKEPAKILDGVRGLFGN